MQRIALRVGAVVGGILIAALGILWWQGRDDGGDAATGQVLHQFDTNDFHSLAFAPSDPETLYFGHHGGMEVTHDGGASWENAALRGVDVMQQSVPVDGSERHYAAGHDVFQASSDGGQTWQAQPNDLPGLDIHGFAAAPSDADRLYAFEVTSSGFYSSADGGASWEALPLPPGMETANLPLAVGYDDPLHVFSGAGEQILESRDGGASWESIPGPGGTILALATDVDDPSMLLVGTVEGLWRHAADGSWFKLPVTPDGAALAVAVQPENSERIAMIDQQGNFYRSDDGGTTWATE